MTPPLTMPPMPVEAAYNEATLSAGEMRELYTRGYQALEVGDIKIACDHFAYLVLLQPQHPQFLFAFACGLQQQKAYAQALLMFTCVLSIQSTDPYAAFHYGECALALEDNFLAYEAFKLTRELCFAQSNDNPSYTTLRQQAEVQLNVLNN